MVLTSALILVIIIAIACAGCTSPNTQGTAQSSSGSGSTGSSAAGGAAAPAAAGGNCPAVDAAHSWNGKWDSHAGMDRCSDFRKAFYPATKDNPDPWGDIIGFPGDMHYPLTFTQTGCDVTGSIIAGPSGTVFTPDGCPITVTSKVDKDNVMSGTWKAYCAITFNAANGAKTNEEGIFRLWMNPEGSGFAGTFQGNNPDIAKLVADRCPDANGNWVGKRA